jgi:hypothetical protein
MSLFLVLQNLSLLNLENNPMNNLPEFSMLIIITSTEKMQDKLIAS